jgi:hypothetical protein
VPARSIRRQRPDHNQPLPTPPTELDKPPQICHPLPRSTIAGENKETNMNHANVITLRILSIGLFIAGIPLIYCPTLSLGLILTGVILACTTILINEIRDAKSAILEKLKKQNASL